MVCFLKNIRCFVSFPMDKNYLMSKMDNMVNNLVEIGQNVQNVKKKVLLGHARYTIKDVYCKVY